MVSERKIKVHIANGHTKTLGLEPETSRAGSHEEPKNQEKARKDKDPKSFTQTLFDTFAMKLLHRTNASYNPPAWAPSNERALPVDSSILDSNSLELKMDKDVSNSTEKDAQKLLIRDPESTRAAHGYHPPQSNSVSDFMLAGSNTTSLNVDPARSVVEDSPKLGEDLEKSETSGNDRQAHLAVNIKTKVSTQADVALPSKCSHLNSQSEELDVAGTRPLQKSLVLAAIQSEPTPDVPAQSLSHFTSANIFALRETRVTCRSDLHEQHCLLKFLGRTDLPQHSSRCDSYRDFLKYSGQSITYILSNIDALLQSFLHCDNSNSDSKAVRCYEFPLIVDLFRKLRRIDMHPYKIFPSLWISAGRLYPVSSATSKRRSLTASDPGSFPLGSPPTNQGHSLNDLEACHVVKIILAALVASVPKCSPMSWLAVRKLHASGQVAPFVDATNSPVEQKTIGKLVRTLHAFENEMALSLVVRLARSIDIRYHLARARALADDADKNRRQFPPTFARVLDYINADSLRMCVAETEGHPSVKCGEWIDPVIELVTWHPKEWPIIIEWLRAVILKEWDGKAKIAKGSAVGGALGLLLQIRK